MGKILEGKDREILVRDLKIRRLTQALTDLLAEMKEHPAWYECNALTSWRIQQAHEAKEVGKCHCLTHGLSLVFED